jgi:hypothetical protein
MRMGREMGRSGRSPRVDRRRAPGNLESLENRTVLNYTPLGYSLPDLTVRGATPPVAAYGGTITITADISNIGHSSLVEPTALEPGAISQADAPASTLGVYLSTNPHRLTRQAVKIGTIDVPPIRQNSTLNLVQTLNMPATRPRRLPPNGGDVFVLFRANDDRSVQELDLTNNLAVGSQPMRLVVGLPELQIEALEVPPILSPGDSIAPSFRIANYGTAATMLQAPVTVQLVASSDRVFDPSDVVLATYTIPNIPPLSSSPSFARTVLGDVTLDAPPNTRTVGGQVVVLPSAPESYFIGLIVDPLRQIRQIRDLRVRRSPILEGLRPVGPPIHGLPPATTTTTPAPADNLFPTPAYGLITSPFFPPSEFGGPAVLTTSTRTVTPTRSVPRRPAQALAGAGRLANRPSLVRLIGLTPPRLTTRS